MSARKSKPSDNVKVVVRIRPTSEEEQPGKYFTVTQAVNDQVLVFDPKVAPSDDILPVRKRNVTRSRRYKDLKYAFDNVFGPTTSNHDVFLHSMECIVHSVLDGYNCSVFAYGATGAGKTHTMLGNPAEPGVIYHTMIDLYHKIDALKVDKEFDVSVSYLEVYNEQVRDLLITDSGSLPIREEKTAGVVISGLSVHKPKSADDLLLMLQSGNENRTQHPTDANAESSRSHAVFQVFISQKHKAASVNNQVKRAKMCLVDLAGSERAHATKNHGARFREGANINRSLLALGNVINALANSKFKGHVPYRDSKLTRLLKDSLGGNCYTVMIAAVSPSSKSYDDTYNTLRYADRAKQIRADLKKNVVNVDLHLANYKKYVEELERENRELRRANAANLHKGVISLNGSQKNNNMASNVKELEDKLLSLFQTRREIRETQVLSDVKARELRWKVSRKEKTIQQIQKLSQSPSAVGKHSRVIERMKRKIESEQSEFESATQRLKSHESLICTTYKDATASGGIPSTSSSLEKTLRLHQAEAALRDTSDCLAFVKKMARAQERQVEVNQRLISSLVSVVKLQHDLITGQAPHLLHDELTESYKECCYLVEERGVSWLQDDNSCAGQPNRDTEDISISDIIDICVPQLQLGVNSSQSPVKSSHNPVVASLPSRVIKSSPEDQVKLKPSSSVTNTKVTNISVTNTKVANVGVTNTLKRQTSATTTPPANKRLRQVESCTSLRSSPRLAAKKKITQDEDKEKVGHLNDTFQVATIRKLEQTSDNQKSSVKNLNDTFQVIKPGENLNDTFQVPKPTLSNTPTIDKLPLRVKSSATPTEPAASFEKKNIFSNTAISLSSLSTKPLGQLSQSMAPIPEASTPQRTPQRVLRQLRSNTPQLCTPQRVLVTEREPLKPVKTNTPQLSAIASDKPMVLTPDDVKLLVKQPINNLIKHEPWKQTVTQSKKSVKSDKNVRQKRALSAPYAKDRSAQRVKKADTTTDKAQRSKPSYMLPTISAVRRVEKEKAPRRGAQRQPYAIPASILTKTI